MLSRRILSANFPPKTMGMARNESKSPTNCGALYQRSYLCEACSWYIKRARDTQSEGRERPQEGSALLVAYGRCWASCSRTTAVRCYWPHACGGYMGCVYDDDKQILSATRRYAPA